MLNYIREQYKLISDQEDQDFNIVKLKEVITCYIRTHGREYITRDLDGDMFMPDPHYNINFSHTLSLVRAVLIAHEKKGVDPMGEIKNICAQAGIKYSNKS